MSASLYRTISVDHEPTEWRWAVCRLSTSNLVLSIPTTCWWATSSNSSLFPWSSIVCYGYTFNYTAQMMNLLEGIPHTPPLVYMLQKRSQNLKPASGLRLILMMVWSKSVKLSSLSGRRIECELVVLDPANYLVYINGGRQAVFVFLVRLSDFRKVRFQISACSPLFSVKVSLTSSLQNWQQIPSLAPQFVWICPGPEGVFAPNRDTLKFLIKAPHFADSRKEICIHPSLHLPFSCCQYLTLRTPRSYQSRPHLLLALQKYVRDNFKSIKRLQVSSYASLRVLLGPNLGLDTYICWCYWVFPWFTCIQD